MNLSRTLFFLAAIVMALVVVTQLAPKTGGALTETKAELVVFGTLVKITTYTPEPDQAQKAIQAVEQRFQQFHHEWHAWEKGGIVSKINRAIADRKPIEVAGSVKRFILKSQQLAKQSDHLFDPGIGQLIALWGFHSESWQGPPPTEPQIRHWLATRPSIQDLYFEGNRLASRNPDVQLDFGGNAKGLALDLAIRQLKQSGIENAVVNIGGDMRVIGSKQGRPWRIGIQDPRAPQTALASAALSGDESIVTSGTYQRFFEWQGKRYSHILNPNSGRPADSFASVTVIHPDATRADAAATALLIAGPNRWQEMAERMGIKQALLVTQNGQLLMTAAMAERIDKLHP